VGTCGTPSSRSYAAVPTQGDILTLSQIYHDPRIHTGTDYRRRFATAAKEACQAEQRQQQERERQAQLQRERATRGSHIVYSLYLDSQETIDDDFDDRTLCVASVTLAVFFWFTKMGFTQIMLGCRTSFMTS